ncbi:MAG: cyclopropane-fatty-acyl-phospholipid synthase family protein [Sphingobium sp.]
MNAHNPPRGRHLLRAGSLLPSAGGPVSRLLTHILAPTMHHVLDRLDERLIVGRMEAWLPDGSLRILGGRAAGPECEVRLTDWRAMVRLAMSGSVGWFRAWQLGEWSSPDPVPLFALFMANARSLGDVARARGPLRWLARALHAWRDNHRNGARRNIAFHYDLGNDFYALWLDAEMNYSSALFVNAGSNSESLEDAQRRKNDMVLGQLDLQDGQSLLEIGCGWGAFASRALGAANIRYDGLTLSAHQKAYAEQRLTTEGKSANARISLTDYRDAAGQYDAIASIEMVEAVGQKYWPAYLETIHRLLKPGGRAVVQYICIDDAIFAQYAASADFIQTYIFPGGMLVSESRFRALAEDAGLQWNAPLQFGLDYAQTLLRWRERFDIAVEQGHLPPSFDASFVQLWRYYLMYCEGGFRGGGINVAQVTLVKPA